MRHVKTPRAPVSAAPLSQAVRSRGLVFTAGIVGIDPELGTMVDGPEGQMRQAIGNLGAVLAEAGSALDRVIKVTLFLQDIRDYGAVNRVYEQLFAPPYPARSAVQVVPPNPDILVEIEAVAEADGDGDGDAT